MDKVQRNEIKVFWAMRFLAFLLIFFHHTPNLNNFVRIPSLAVSFFIIISGFLNGTLYIDKYNSGWKFRDVIQFLKSKIKKIYPVHLVMFFYTIPLTGIFGYTTYNQLRYWIRRAICNLTLTQSWINNKDYYFSFNGVSWYLSTFIFLMIITIPVISILNKIRKQKNSNFIMVLIAIILFTIDIAYVYFIKKNSLNNEYYLYTLPIARVPEYLIGLIFGVVSLSIKDSEKTTRRILWTFLEILAMVPLVICIIYKPFDLGALDSCFDTKNTWWIIPIIIILMIYKYEKGFISMIVGNRLLVYFGKLSMILFMIHQPLISYANKMALNQNSILNKYFLCVYLLILCMVLAIIINKLFIKKKQEK